jgi:hypothetical protein
MHAGRVAATRPFKLPAQCRVRASSSTRPHRKRASSEKYGPAVEGQGFPTLHLPHRTKSLASWCRVRCSVVGIWRVELSISAARSSRESPRTSMPQRSSSASTQTSRRDLRPPRRRAQAGNVAHRGGSRPQTRRPSRRRSFAGPGHSENKMILAIYTRPTEGMRDPRQPH